MLNNPHLVSRLAKSTTAADLMLMFENRERYAAQSAATKAGARAPIPPRPALSRLLRSECADNAKR